MWHGISKNLSLLCVHVFVWLWVIHLHPQDAKDNEEGTADKDDVPNGSKRGNQSLHDQL